MRRSGHRSERTTRYGPRALALAVALVLVATAAAVPVGAAPTPAAADDAPGVVRDTCTGGCAIPGTAGLASVFPTGGDRETPRRSDPEVVELGDDRTGDLLDALSSGTARELLRRLLEEPLTPSELAEAADTSVQNVHYHLGRLHDAGAVAVVDVEYSSRGREMSVYAATCRPQVTVYDLE